MNTMLLNKSRAGGDELYTPVEATEMIIPFIPYGIKTIWEPASDVSGEIAKVLLDYGYKVITGTGDFFDNHDFEFDMIITNPPYTLKDQFIAKCYALGKPWMLLLPTTALEGQKRQSMYRDNDIALLLPNKRFNFMPEKKSAWFHTSWFCSKTKAVGLNFIELKKCDRKVKPQLTMF